MARLRRRRAGAVSVGQRAIVVLRYASLAERVRRAGGQATETEMRRGRRPRSPAQKQIAARLSREGVQIVPDFVYTRTLNGFAAALDARALALLDATRTSSVSTPSASPIPPPTHAAAGRDEFGPRRAGAPCRACRARRHRVTIALLDTGIDSTHPYLRGRVLEGIDILDPEGRGSRRPHPTIPRSSSGTARSCGPADRQRRPGRAPGRRPVRPCCRSGSRAGSRAPRAASRCTRARISCSPASSARSIPTPTAARSTLPALRWSASPSRSPPSPMGRSREPSAGAARSTPSSSPPPATTATTGPRLRQHLGARAARRRHSRSAAPRRRGGPRLRLGSSYGPACASSSTGAAARRSRRGPSKPLTLALVRPGPAASARPSFTGRSAVFFDRRRLQPRRGQGRAPRPPGATAGVAAAGRARGRRGRRRGRDGAGRRPRSGRAGGTSRSSACPARCAREARADDRAWDGGHRLARRARLGRQPGHRAVALFSSHGLAFGGGLKPEVTAPGVELLTADIGRNEDDPPATARSAARAPPPRSPRGPPPFLVQARPGLDAYCAQGRSRRHGPRRSSGRHCRCPGCRARPPRRRTSPRRSRQLPQRCGAADPGRDGRRSADVKRSRTSRLAGSALATSRRT